MLYCVQNENPNFYPDEAVLADEEFDHFDTDQMDETSQEDIQLFLPLIER